MSIEELRAVIREIFPSYTTDSYFKNDDDTVGYKWITGGRHGSWHGDGGNRKAEPEPRSWLLDDVLERVCPRISYLHYKRILDAMEEGSDYENGYYGDETYYATRSITVTTLYDLLVAMGEL